MIFVDVLGFVTRFGQGLFNLLSVGEYSCYLSFHLYSAIARSILKLFQYKYISCSGNILYVCYMSDTEIQQQWQENSKIKMSITKM